jgi:hypothetical protein
LGPITTGSCELQHITHVIKGRVKAVFNCHQICQGTAARYCTSLLVLFGCLVSDVGLL